MSDASREITGVRVGATSVGQGVFALRRFRKGACLAPVTGTVVKGADYEGSEYAIDLTPDTTLEPGPPFRFLNHSCDPNCALVLSEEENDAGEVVSFTVYLEALRAIRSGEELTIDYGWSAEAAIPCHCGAASCRHWVVAESELARLAADAS